MNLTCSWTKICAMRQLLHNTDMMEPVVIIVNIPNNYDSNMKRTLLQHVKL